MILDSLHKQIDKFYTYRFYLLLITLLLNFFVTPLVTQPIAQIVIKLITSAGLMLAGANFIKRDKMRLRNSWFFLGFLIIISVAFADIIPENVIIETIQYVMLFMFFVGIAVNLIQQLFLLKEVTADVIVGSFCGYILIGLISYILFVIIDFYIPNSFTGLSTNFTTRISDIFYFTFTCLTTLGFGDILPANVISQKLAVFTAIAGQFYIAVVVAILVSRFLQKSNS